MSAHVLISTAQNGQELTHGVCCQNQESKGTTQHCELHSGASISGHSTSVTVLGLLKEEEEEKKKKELVQNGVLAIFRLATKTL